MQQEYECLERLLARGSVGRARHNHQQLIENNRKRRRNSSASTSRSPAMTCNECQTSAHLRNKDNAICTERTKRSANETYSLQFRVVCCVDGGKAAQSQLLRVHRAMELQLELKHERPLSTNCICDCHSTQQHAEERKRKLSVMYSVDHKLQSKDSIPEPVRTDNLRAD